MDNDIKQKVETAIRDGAPQDEAVRRGMALQASRDSQKQAVSTQVPVTTGQQAREGALASIGGGAINLGKSLLESFRGLGADVIDIAKYATGGEKAFAGGYKNPLRSEEELTKTRNQQDLKGFIEDQARKTAGIMSYGVPFGKVGFVGSKFAVPGAAVGAAQTASQPGTTLPEIVGGGVVGGVTGLGMQGVGKVIQGVKGGSKVAEEAATKLEQGTRQIKQKASVYGAANEKAINNTLDRLGFKGGAQKQYENLQPAMDKLETEIQNIVKSNPEISVVKEDIKKSFLTKLKSSLRSKDMTQSQARTEVEGYLKDLIKASGGKGKFTNISLDRLRNLKKLVNEDYGAVHDIIERGGTLTPRQKVIEVAWSSLDDAVKSASPEMKKVLLDESNLYKAAQSLSAARFNPPTFRLMGTSVPPSVTQKGREFASGVLRRGAKIGQGVTGNLPNISPTIAGQTVARLGTGIEEVGNEKTQTDQYNQNNPEPHILPSIPQMATGSQTLPDISQTATGFTVEQLAQGYSKALMANDKASATQIKQLFDMENNYQKTKKSKISSEQQKSLGKLTTGETILKEFEKNLNEMGLIESGPLARGAGAKRKIASKLGFDPQAKAYSDMRQATASLLAKSLGEVGNLNEGDVQRAIAAIPDLGDSREEVQRKLAFIRNIIVGAKQGIMSLPQAEPGLPDIPQEGIPNYGFAQ